MATERLSSATLYCAVFGTSVDRDAAGILDALALDPLAMDEIMTLCVRYGVAAEVHRSGTLLGSVTSAGEWIAS